jgi:predicted TPR repeat methyltransferase
MTAENTPAVSDPSSVADGDDQIPTELSLSDALALAIYLHRSEQWDDAQLLYRRILEAAPEQPDALHFLGVLSHQRGRSEAAIDLIERSIALDPQHADRYNNLGNVLVEIGRLPEATEAYEKAIDLQPGHADAYNNLGTVLRAQGRYDDAAVAYQKAIELNPDHIDAYNNFGNLLSSRGMVREAVAYYCKAITLIPNHPQARKLLGIAYYTIGQVDAAAQVFREWQKEEPANPVAHHMLAACSGENVPLRASDAYVESTFDAFAGSFDAKLEKLAYRAPQLVADALAKASGAPAKRLVVLDAGCGTGLCGPLIAPYVSRLIGVDLSAGMLNKARGRGVYQGLFKAELTSYLGDHADEFDLVISADTLVYFGALQSVADAAFCALRPGGLLIFTVEEAVDGVPESGYRINPHGRYSHSRAYVQSTLMGAGFEEPAMEGAVLRMEAGNPVAGLVATARKPGGVGSSAVGAI